MKRRVLMLTFVPFFSALGAYAQGNVTGVPASGTAYTGVTATCPSGKLIPANTPFPAAYINNPEAYFCGSGGGSSVGASILDPALQTAAYDLGRALGQWLFGGNNEAAAAQQKAYLAEMERRRQETERQRILADQQRQIQQQGRIDEMFQRFTAAMKLDDLPSLRGLRFKDTDSSSTGDLTFKLGNDVTKPYGIPGLPGIYVGGPALPTGNSMSAAQDQGDKPLAFKTDDDSAGGLAGCKSSGIQGLPGIYLDKCGTPQSSAFLSNGNPIQVAQVAQSLPGPERAIVEDRALRLAEANPQLMAISQESRLTSFQELDKDYQKTQLSYSQAAQTLQQTQHQNDAAQAAVNSAQSEVAEHQGTGSTLPGTVQHALDNLNNVAKTDEEAAVRAQHEFDNASVNVAMARTKAAYALIAVAPQSNEAVVDLSRKQQPLFFSNTIKPPRPVAEGPIVPPSGPSVATARTALELCKEESGLEEALRRLSRTETSEATDRQQWLTLMDDATRDAAKQAADFATDGSVDLLSRYLNHRMQGTVIRRAGDGIDADRRRQLDEEFKALWNTKRIVENWQLQRKQIKVPDPFDPQNWKSVKAKDLQDWLDDVKNAIDKTLDRPEVRSTLKLSEEGAKVISLSESIMDSGYNISREIISIKQIEMLNENADKYLAAVNRLKEKMQDTIRNPSFVINCSANSATYMSGVKQ